MKRYIWIMICAVAAVAAYAVPAKRGWQTMTQSDGSTIELQLIGDEHFHYWVNCDGQEVRLNTKGMYEVVGDVLTPARAPKRSKMQVRKQRQEFGVRPNLAPKGIVILVNFDDVDMKADHTRQVFDELFNSENCMVNVYDGKQYPSAAEYFKAQSNGAYHPQFDVFGPVTLSKEAAFYGENDDDGNDMYPSDAVIEACHLVKEQYPELNFADYDSDLDDYVDFIYVIYAGRGEADGGGANTIWPHNWEIAPTVIPYSCDEEDCWYDPDGDRLSCCYTEEDIVIDGKILNSYAMSAELSGHKLCGIGTLCHEFSHVLGLPDFYDTEYETNYSRRLTPNEWNIMDGGSYNGDGHCPPNYDVWEKYFMGWIVPENLGDNPASLTLFANGTDGYEAYQINASGKQQASTHEGLNYYIEHRRQIGWDEYLPAEGMLIWKVDYSEEAWVNNVPNNEANKPRYTLVIPSGTKIGDGYGPQNVWPYQDKNSWDGVDGKPLKGITRSDQQITLTYIENPTAYTVQWFVNGELLESREYNKDGSEDIVLPTKPVQACEGTNFIGWTLFSDWCDPFEKPSDLNSAPEGKVTKSVNYYAVFE